MFNISKPLKQSTKLKTSHETHQSFLSQPYTGNDKLVLAYDIGTTFSGGSYCLLQSGIVPLVQGIKGYPGMWATSKESKIPSVLYYDKSGDVRAAGAEAIGERIERSALDEDWYKAYWFKPHLRPNTTSSADVPKTIPPLPEGKTVVQIFADFLQYLHRCARTHIEESNLSGVRLWQRLEPTVEYVLSHPNIWEGGQQAVMRQAAILAGLIPDTERGRSRIFFVTEGEASLHFCIARGLASKATEEGKGIVVVDAGGGTIDISAYSRTSLNSQSYEEIAPARCAFKGSIFVTSRANAHFEKLLGESPQFKQDIPDVTREFDERTKVEFEGPDHPCPIKFTGRSVTAKDFNIQGGYLMLSGTQVAEFFEPSISAIISIVEAQCKIAKVKISSLFLVGGFAGNKWLYTNLKRHFEPEGLDVCRPDYDTRKAVADGAVFYHLYHHVGSRVAKYFYGIKAELLYIDSDPEHISRCHSVYTGPDGKRWISGGFSVILSRGTTVLEKQEFSQFYTRSAIHKDHEDLMTVPLDIQCYRGLKEDPKWIDEEPNMYSTLCLIQADLSGIPRHERTSKLDKSRYYQVEFNVILSLGLTEIKACIAWEKKGIEMRSEAKLIFDTNKVIHDTPIIL